MKTNSLTVALADRSYPIYFADCLPALQTCVADLRTSGRPVRVISDASVLEAHGQYLESAGFTKTEILALPAGEHTKSVGRYAEVLSFLASQSCNRDCALFAFGGGVIGDLAGFVAASYLRGVDFYQIPTTLLAMVDSSVGGKTGINLPEGKNLVGAFWQPKAVFIDTALLTTLPDREFAAGMAEVIKYGLLADAALLAELENLPELSAATPELPGIIRRCCEIKAGIVADDETETAQNGGRALLNLGHTFAHAIENVAGYGTYLHGEAVAIGLVLASRLSVALGQLPDAATDRVIKVLQQHHLPTQLGADYPVDTLMQAMQKDKKNRSGKLRFVTMRAIGEAVTTDGVSPERIRELWTSRAAGQ